MDHVAAAPAVVPQAAVPGGWEDRVYYQWLHGSPKVYHSAYCAEDLDALARGFARAADAAPVRCIFDNTAIGAANADAPTILGQLHQREGTHS